MAQKAGTICGNPICGLSERICINVRKIFDGCITRYSDRTFTLAFDGELEGTAPFTFVEARSSGPSVVTDLVVTPLGRNRNRVQMVVTTPVTVTYTDSTGATFTATSTVSIPRDVILNLPEDSLSAYLIDVATNLVATIGEFDDGTLTITACVVQIIRVIVNVDILVPSYGYCEYPSCDEYADEVCRELFNLPIFPTGT